jgi:hypothetical protein
MKRTMQQLEEELFTIKIDNGNYVWLAEKLTDQIEERFNNTKVLKHPALVEHNEKQFTKELAELRKLLKQIK